LSVLSVHCTLFSSFLTFRDTELEWLLEKLAMAFEKDRKTKKKLCNLHACLPASTIKREMKSSILPKFYWILLAEAVLHRGIKLFFTSCANSLIMCLSKEERARIKILLQAKWLLVSSGVCGTCGHRKAFFLVFIILIALRPHTHVHTQPELWHKWGNMGNLFDFGNVLREWKTLEGEWIRK
jgi:hypothetical protein